MRKVSYWAKHNVQKARLLIILSEILLFVLALWLGCLLLQWKILLANGFIFLPLSGVIAALLIARYKKTSQFRNRRFYRRQRLSFFLLGLSVFVLTVTLVGSEKWLSWNTYSPVSGSGFSVLVKPAPTPGERLSAKQVQKVERFARKMQNHSGLAVLYVSLIILGGLLLLALIASLSCSLSCNGNGALALMLFALGSGGVIFLCVWLIRKILNNKAVQNTDSPAISNPSL